MRRRRAALTALVLGAVALVPVTQARADDAGADTATGVVEARGEGGEFVVSLSGDASTAAATLEASGAEVFEINAELGIALVGSDDAGFLDAATASGAITAGARNHSVGTEREGQPHQVATERLTAKDESGQGGGGGGGGGGHGKGRPGFADPLASFQWDMQMMGVPAAQQRATGKGVTVGIIDTGVDASHPDIAPNFSKKLSRNFVMDIPAIDGPCEVATCIDPADVDDGGHGTHVAGTVAAAKNGIGITGVAPDATIVNVRAGQDSGYFFLYETVAALTYAGDAKLDVVNMSFYTDPWLYNCASMADVISGPVTQAQIDEQAFVRSTILAAVEYARGRGVTLVAAAGNGLTNLALPERFDDSSPDYPGGTEIEQVVTKNCLDLPAEAPGVIAVSAVGPSGTKSDYSNYGLGDIDVAAPGGWFRDFVGTDQYRLDANLVLSSYPLHVAIEEGLADANGQPTDARSKASCDKRGNNCGFYTYLQGTSMASPHVAGLAALVIERYGDGNARRGYSLDPDAVTWIIERSAVDHACPAGGTEIYTDEGRPPEYNAICEGTTDYNGLYGEGIVSATRALNLRWW